MKEASFYKKLDGNDVQCVLCPHTCRIPNQKTGICGVRKNIDGVLYSLVYGKAVAEHADPIEKKPLFNFYPGSRSYSVSTVGCNFSCLHCQNAEISQAPRDGNVIMGSDRTPEEIVDTALAAGCSSISYTYTEPTIYFEYAYETARLASQQGIRNVFVSNGYINREPLEQISPYLDAANIDLKGFSEKFYTTVCKAKLQPVLESIYAYRKLGIWIEITTLLIPDFNDSPDELRQIASFIAAVGNDVPWHVTAFYPTYRLLDKPRTPVQTLLTARRIGLEAGLRYVYTGNVPGAEGENTYCYSCGNVLIKRVGFSIVENRTADGVCPACKTPVDGSGI